MKIEAHVPSIPLTIDLPCADGEWLEKLRRATLIGRRIAPRGHPTLEVLNDPGQTISLPMSKPIITCRTRKLNYSFMAAEALWMTSGDNRVETIARYNKNIAQFSDDGEIFNGAYGPMITSQEEHVLSSIFNDVDTRQAVITIWKPNPVASKDIPCTITLVFSARPVEHASTFCAETHRLHLHAFMRSSDLWLGVPYDIFNFSMIGVRMACLLNQRRQPGAPLFALGHLTLTAVSSHLYERNIEEAQRVAQAVIERPYTQITEVPSVPINRVMEGDWDSIISALEHCRDKSTDKHPTWNMRPWRLGDIT